MKSIFYSMIILLNMIPSNIMASTATESSIVFAETYLSVDEKGQHNLLSNYTFDKKNDLFIRVNLEQPLIEYLKKLSPVSDDQDLIEHGNYQFSFHINGELIYTEELNPGAGTIESKSKWTSFMVPLQSKEEIDSWGRFLWNRFLNNGGKKALGPGLHKLQIEIRPYYQDEKLEVGEIIASGSLQIKKNTKQVSERRKAVQKIKSRTTFSVAPNRINEKIITELNQEILLKIFPEVTSMMVIKENQLILEEYFNGARAKTLHDTRSVGKTVAGMVLGIAIQEGHITSVDQKLSEFYDLNQFKNYDARKEDITIKDLLTMSSGMDAFDFQDDSPGHEENMYPTDDWVKFTLNLPMSDQLQSGNDWRYSSAGAVLLGDIIDKSVPGGLEQYTNEKLFEPLDIKKFKWQHTPTGVANTAGSLQLSTLDLAKIGQLYQNDGIYNGLQILNAEWINNSLSRQINIPFLDDAYYGYLLWNKTYSIDNQTHECFYASGNGGNKIFIFKELPLVVVITAKAYNSMNMHEVADEILQEYILKAVLTK